MSSHHIVKDEQEPSLIVLSFSEKEIDIILELLEWSPFVMVHYNCLEAFIRQQLKFDIVLAKPDGVKHVLETGREQQPFQILEYENSALSESLHYLVARKFDAVNIVCTSNMLQQAEFIVKNSLFNQLSVNFIEGWRRHLLIRKGKYKKWMPAGAEITITPIFYTTLTILNENKTLKSAKWSCSCNQDGFIEVSGDGPFMFSE